MEQLLANSITHSTNSTEFVLDLCLSNTMINDEQWISTDPDPIRNNHTAIVNFTRRYVKDMIEHDKLETWYGRGYGIFFNVLDKHDRVVEETLPICTCRLLDFCDDVQAEANKLMTKEQTVDREHFRELYHHTISLWLGSSHARTGIYDCAKAGLEPKEVAVFVMKKAYDKWWDPIVMEGSL